MAEASTGYVPILTGVPGFVPGDIRLVSDHELRVRLDADGGWYEMTLAEEGGRFELSDRASLAEDRLGPPRGAARELASWFEARVLEAGSASLAGALLPGEGPAAALADARLDAESLVRLLAPVVREGEQLFGAWRLVDVAPTLLDGDPAVVMAFLHDRESTPWHIVVGPAREDAPPWMRTERFRVKDYASGPSEPPDTGVLRAFVLFALQLLERSAGRSAAVEVAPSSTVLGAEDLAADVLSPADLEHFRERGYVVLREAVSPDDIAAIHDAVSWFLSLDPTVNSEGFYTIPRYTLDYLVKNCFVRAGSNLEMYQHQALWNTRQHPRVHRAFAQLWEDDALWVTIDRVNVKRPFHKSPTSDWREEGFVHWDIDTDRLPVPFGLQGVLALSDTDEDMGGFHCVPGFHREERFLEWARTQPPDRDRRRPDTTGLTLHQVPAKAGDLVIWHHALPHGNGLNRTDRVRMAQYIAMYPASRGNERDRLRRIRDWRERRSNGDHYEGDPLEREVRFGRTAELTPLGRRLLGLEPW